MKKIYFTITGFLLGLGMFSQEIKTGLPTIVPPSPTVAALMKFEEVPVNNYTGIPDISIPLFSTPTHSKDINLSIGLSYHSGGVGLKEHAGDVGLGWSLMAGGTISRTVRGFPDEYCKGGSSSKRGIYQDTIYDDVTNNYYEILEAAVDPDSADSLQTEKFHEYLWNGVVRGYLDSEHDLWQFNFMGFSGRFYIEKDSTGGLVVKPLDDYRIKIINHYNTAASSGTNYKYTPLSFDVFDDKGYKYVFDQVEVTKTWTNSYSIAMLTGLESLEDDLDLGKATTYNSAFHLSKVYDNNGNLIVDLRYMDGLIVENAVDRSRTQNYELIPEGHLDQSLDYISRHHCGLGGLYNMNPPPRQMNTATYRSTKAKKLLRIDAVDVAKILFNFEQGRIDEDFSGPDSAYVFKGIVVKDWNDSIRKKVILEQSNDGYKNRMKLSRVRFGAHGTDKEEVYELEYRPSTDEDDLPEDPWGYAAAPDAIYPENTDYTASTADLLLKMTLPTGGCAVYDFEQNQYSYIGSTALTNFDENDGNWIGHDNNYTFESDFGTSSTSLFTIVDAQDVRFDVNVDIPEGFHWKFSIDSKGVENDPHTYPDNECSGGSCSKTFHFEPGTYYVSFDSDDKLDIAFPADFNAYIIAYFKTKASVQKKYLYGGGNRIRRISYFTEDINAGHFLSYNDTLPTREKRYSYHLLTDAAKSSGSLAFEKPLFQYEKYKDECMWCEVGTPGTPIDQYRKTFHYRVTTTQNNLQSLRTQGADVGYSNVTVFETGNGRIESTYTSPISDPETFNEFTLKPPFMPTKNIDYKRGLLKKEEVFNEAGDSLKVTTMDYAFADYLKVTGIRLYYANEYVRGAVNYDTYDNYMNSAEYCEIYPSTAQCFCNFGMPETFVNALPVKEAYGWAKLSSKTTKEYFYEGTNQKTVQTNEEFSYNDTNKQLSWHTTTGSEGEIMKTEYFYHTGNSTFSQNRISEIEEIKSYNDSDLLSRSKIIYNNEGTIHPWRPQFIQAAKGNLTLEDKLKLSEYDSFGNIKEVLQADGNRTFYVWGYNDTQPIVKIESPTNLSLPGTLITAIKGFAQENDTVHFLEKLEDLRESLPDCMITGYMYIPLVGIKSITDPKGYTTSYKYDEFGRLKLVRDNDGTILSENQYNYRLQQP